MNVKIDTKEKFVEISVLEQQITANMAVELEEILSELLKTDKKNVILKFDAVQGMEVDFAESLAGIQADFYEKGASFVICNLQPNVKQGLDEAELYDIMNITPTLSEAWDMVQMEEIERELLDGL